MIKLFASDLDGTLLTNHVMDDIVLNAVRAIRAQNRVFVIATGRTMYPHQRVELGLESVGVYTAAMNGAVLFDPEGNLLYRMEIPPDLIAGMLHSFPDVVYEFDACDRMLVRQSRKGFIDFVQHDPTRNAEGYLSMFLPTMEFDASEEVILQAGIVKINARIPDPGAAAAMNQFLNENKSRIINQPFREDVPGLFEITAANAGKEQAIIFLQKRLGIKSTEVAVYGDGPNDCEMLQCFPNSFAPKNAATSAKNAASQIIGRCEDHAVPCHMLEMLKEERNMQE